MRQWICRTPLLKSLQRSTIAYKWLLNQKVFIFTSTSFPEQSTLGDASNSCPEDSTLVDVSSGFPKHLTLGATKSSINIRLGLGTALVPCSPLNRLCSSYMYYKPLLRLLLLE